MLEEVGEYFLEVLHRVNLGHVFRCLGRNGPDPGQDLHTVRVDILTSAKPNGDPRLRGHLHLLLGLLNQNTRSISVYVTKKIVGEIPPVDFLRFLAFLVLLRWSQLIHLFWLV